MRGQFLQRAPVSGLHVYQEFMSAILDSGARRTDTRAERICPPGLRSQPLKLRSMPRLNSTLVEHAVQEKAPERVGRHQDIRVVSPLSPRQETIHRRRAQRVIGPEYHLGHD